METPTVRKAAAADEPFLREMLYQSLRSGRRKTVQPRDSAGSFHLEIHRGVGANRGYRLYRMDPRCAGRFGDGKIFRQGESGVRLH
jgi:hypothetical protein